MWKKYLHNCILIGIVVLAAFLRLYRISEYMTFLGDEGRDMLVVKHILEGKLTLLGPTASVGGFFLGPIYYYLMAPFVWMFRLDPVGGAVMVAFFGIATVYLVYRVCEEWFSKEAGLIAAGMYALSPLVIAYSRSSWNPNPVPFFSLMLFYSLWKGVRKNDWRWFLLSGGIAGIGIQLHYLFLFLFPVVGIYMILYMHKRYFFLQLFTWILGFIVGYSPFLAFELRHGFPNSISIFNFLTTGKDTGLDIGRFFTIVPDVTMRIFGRLLFRLPPPEQMHMFPSYGIAIWEYGVKLFISISFFVLLYRLIREKRNKDSSTYSVLLLLALWILIPIVLFGFYHKGIYDYYFGIVFVVPFFFIAMLAHELWKRFSARFIVVGITTALLFFQWGGMPFKNPPNNQLGQTKLVAKEAFDMASGSAFNFALITGGNSDHAYRYFFEVWGNPPVTIEPVVNDPERKSVTGQLIVLCEQSECNPLGHPLWEIAGFGRADIVETRQVSFVTIKKLVAHKEDSNE